MCARIIPNKVSLNQGAGVAYVVWQIGADKPTNVIATIRTGVYTNAVRLAPSHAITNGPALSLQLQLVSPTQTPSEETP